MDFRTAIIPFSNNNSREISQNSWHIPNMWSFEFGKRSIMCNCDTRNYPYVHGNWIHREVGELKWIFLSISVEEPQFGCIAKLIGWINACIQKQQIWIKNSTSWNIILSYLIKTVKELWLAFSVHTTNAIFFSSNIKNCKAQRISKEDFVVTAISLE